MICSRFFDVWSRLFAGRRIWLGLAAALVIMSGCSGRVEQQAEQTAHNVKQTVEETMIAKQNMKICRNQTYALCATARCNVYDGVAYCQCQVKSGNSISLPFPMGKGDVCSVNAAGAKNQYMVSTYSLPHEVVAGQGKQAVYDCKGGIHE